MNDFHTTRDTSCGSGSGANIGGCGGMLHPINDFPVMKSSLGGSGRYEPTPLQCHSWRSTGTFGAHRDGYKSQ